MSKHDPKKSDSSPNRRDDTVQLGGFMDGFANILGKLGELAEKGEAIRREGNFEAGNGKDIRGSYGFSIKMGADGKQSSSHASVKPHKAKPAAAPRESAPAIREARVDLFEDGDHVTIIAEMPGVPAENVSLRFEDRKMWMEGNAARLKFEAEVDLPISCSPDDVSVTANNGLVEVRLQASKE